MHLRLSRITWPLVSALLVTSLIITPLIIGKGAWTPLFLGLLALTAALTGLLLGSRDDALKAAAHADALTGLANRRRYDEVLQREVAKAHRDGSPLAVLVLDLDDLKGINDRLGHAAGDRALQVIAEALKHSCRPTDLVARWGGDEFAVVAPGTTEDQARGLAERIASTVHLRSADHRPVLELGRSVSNPTLSISIGVAAADRQHPAHLTPSALFQSADRALYQAKAAGQGRVQLASGDGRVTRAGRSLRLVASSARGHSAAGY